MKKLCVAISLLLSTVIVTAQENRLHLQISPELAFPTGDFSKVVKTGWGANVKGMYLLKTRDYVTLTAGYQYFKVQTLVGGVISNYTIIPFLVGYRKTYKKIFFESQVGMGLYSLKAKSTVGSATNRNNKFTWSQSFGHDFGSLELQLRYQQGSFKDDQVGMFALGLNYHFDFK